MYRYQSENFFDFFKRTRYENVPPAPAGIKNDSALMFIKSGDELIKR